MFLLRDGIFVCAVYRSELRFIADTTAQFTEIYFQTPCNDGCLRNTAFKGLPRFAQTLSSSCKLLNYCAQF